MFDLEIEGMPYEFDDDRDLTLSAMRHIKKWFPELGDFTSFRLGYLRGDPDALACVRWIVLGKAGVQPNPPPTNPADFSLGDFMRSFVSHDITPCEHCGGVDDGVRRVQGRGWNPVEEDEPEPDPLVQAPVTSPAPVPSDTPEETPKSSETITSFGSEPSPI